MLGALFRGGFTTHINDPAKGTNSIGSVYGIRATSRVFHNCTCNHNDVLSRMSKLLDDKMDHLS